MVMDDLLNSAGHCRRYMDLCALANIADCMSMKSLETRYYIMEGLKHIYNKGFQAFINQQSYSLFKETQMLGYVNVSFYIAPLINAIVRVGTMEEKRLLFEAFINPTAPIQTNKRGARPGDMEQTAIEIARRAANARTRQNKTKETAVSILDNRVQKEGLFENKILIIEVEEDDKVPQELRGLICAQFVNSYHRPCAIVARNKEGYLRGSMRGNAAFEGVPDFKSFLENSGCVEFVQGHANAAGLSIHESQLQNLLAYANNRISDEDLSNAYQVDYIFSADEDITPYAISIAEKPDLWGGDIEEPRIVIENIPFENWGLFLMGADKTSIKFSHNGVDYVKFKDTDFIQEMRACRTGTITVYGMLKKNTWNGRTTAQVFIQDYEIVDTSNDF